MQSLKELLLNRRTEGGSEATTEVVEPSYTCPKCKDFGWVYADVPPGDPMYGRAVTCDCGLASKGMIDRLRKWAELPEGTEFFTFTNFFFKGKPPEIHYAFDAAWAFAEGTSKYKWLILSGPPGVGKTHLAIAIIRHRLESLDPKDPQGYGKYILVPDFLDELRATFDDEAQNSYLEVSTLYKEAPLLVLDDLGAESHTPWVNEKLDQLLDWRYVRRKETVITMNYGVDSLGLRIADRIGDNREGRSLLVAMSGPSHRGKR